MEVAPNLFFINRFDTRFVKAVCSLAKINFRNMKGWSYSLIYSGGCYHQEK